MISFQFRTNQVILQNLINHGDLQSLSITANSELFTAKVCQSHSKAQVGKECMVTALLALYRKKSQIIKQAGLYHTNYMMHNTI